ncbi:MAG: phosphoribosyltransferase [Hyphomicrobiaceae bacterium]|nr:MAG: phosphoribosyltransferase [Hyphomicrobiaceae bacterium]
MRFLRPFADRRAAGRALARVLAKRKLADPVVLALPRGGVPVAAEIARVLKAPLDIVLVRKIGVPFQPELAAAAVVDGDSPQIVTNADVMALAGVTRDEIEAAAKRELEEIERRRKAYLKDRARVPLEGRTLILVDDGIATGASIRAAVRGLRKKQPKMLILAVPVAPADTVQELRKEVDEVVCLTMPEPFFAIGTHYIDFHQMSDEEVVELLAQQEREASSPGPVS